MVPSLGQAPQPLWISVFVPVEWIHLFIHSTKHRREVGTACSLRNGYPSELIEINLEQFHKL